MNFLDLIMLLILVAGAVYGSKIGFVRETIGVIGLIGAIVLAVHYNDFLTAEMEDWLQVSPLWASLAAFVLASALLYALFKFMAKLLYRVAEVQKLGKTDKFGGAIAGIAHGWFLGGFLIFMLLYIPLPRVIEDRLESSYLAVRMASAVPFVYEATGGLHPSEKSFVLKLEDSLTGQPSSIKPDNGDRNRRRPLTAVDRARINEFLDRVERLFFEET